MSKLELAERASLEFLKKLAKDRLQELRRVDPKARRADALLSIARDYGFPSWRALKSEMDQRESGDVAQFPMIRVPNIAQPLDWYTSIGFTEIGRVGNGGSVDWGMSSFGKAQLMFMPGKADPQAVRLWFYTSRIDRLYQLVKSRLMQSAQAVLSDTRSAHASRLSRTSTIRLMADASSAFGI